MASWQSTYRGLIPDDVLESRTLDVRLAQWHSVLVDPSRLSIVACEQDAMLGFASAVLLDGAEGFDSYLQALYLLPQAQGRGIGRELLHHLSRRLRGLGMRSMVLRTLRLSRARGFYERFGARLVHEGIRRDEGHFDDVVYAFDDIRVLE